MAAVFADKALLRKGMLRTLRALTEEQLSEQSAAVFNVLRQQKFYQEARSVGCYLSMKKGELRTGAIVSDLLQSNKALYTPYLPPAASQADQDTPLMEMLRLYSPADLAACPLDKWGILDPGTVRRDAGHDGERREDVNDTSAPALDLILVPGVAFDAACNRVRVAPPTDNPDPQLGRGKAHYDRFLASYSSTRGKPLLIALALSPQLVDTPVPVTPSDFVLDGVVSPSGLVWRDGAQR
ncbi:5-formyltetrahydrofolate cyclo-ligase [Vanrija pseudolonga]|uniref:5-formyltetrahydrofolate cyclo-ligase n=1 Tax=Vanrija pseudolonga TaxID=143232 RepID=A0AAF1BQ07_9TREE|nr:5-formyltetrahydrofolate cyclo-ligase [Vanrija pseudolonga]